MRTLFFFSILILIVAAVVLVCLADRGKSTMRGDVMLDRGKSTMRGDAVIVCMIIVVME